MPKADQQALIRTKGRSIIVRKHPAGGSATDTTVLAVARNVSRKNVDGVTIRATDRSYVIAADDLAAEPDVSETLVVDGTTILRAVHLITYPIGSEIWFYELVARAS